MKHQNINIFQYHIKARYLNDLDYWIVDLMPYESVTNNNILNKFFWQTGLTTNVRVELSHDLTTGVIGNSETVLKYEKVVETARYDFYQNLPREIIYKVMSFFNRATVAVEIVGNWVRIIQVEGWDNPVHFLKNYKVLSDTHSITNLMLKRAIGKLNKKICSGLNSEPTMYAIDKNPIF